jgi:hypothetical protein
MNNTELDNLSYIAGISIGFSLGVGCMKVMDPNIMSYVAIVSSLIFAYTQYLLIKKKRAAERFKKDLKDATKV